MSEFDPGALQGLEFSLDDDSFVVQADAEELRRVANSEMRRRLIGVKLASRIVGTAVALSSELDDKSILQSIQDVMGRVAKVRAAGLKAVSIDRSEPDQYVSAFNILGSVAIDVATQEWKWSRIDPDDFKPLSDSLLVEIFKAAISNQEITENFNPDFSGELELSRKLCVIEATTKLYGVMNYFDYYQKDLGTMLAQLLRSVVKEAERLFDELAPNGATSYTLELLLQRVYSTSTGLMCEVYKECAARDVMRLRSLPSLERSIEVMQYERLSGMSFEHIISLFESRFARMVEVSELIIESQAKR